jgi:DNA-binding NarL/FixJ family response regulator
VSLLGEMRTRRTASAELAARGLTNREVAAALFMSPKTVEANLARAYGKLGISTRAELGAQMTKLVQT